MDYDDEILSKRCYKCDVQPIEDFSIHYNPTSKTTILWNKYQVFFYENLGFSATTKIFISEYQISQILLTNNFLLCLDGNGDLHVTVLKFKNSTQKQKKLLFQPRENNIKTFLQYKEDIILSLKYEYDTYFLCLHKLSTDFKIIKKTILILNRNWPVTEKKGCIMIKTPLTKEILTSLTRKTPEKYQFISSIKTDCDLVIFCFNNEVFCCIISSKVPEEEIELIQLYSCPTEVTNIEIIVSNYAVISLSIGTVIRLNLTNISAPPDIVHLNMAVQKLIAIKDNFVYTDGVSLWKTEDIFSEKLKLKNLSVKLVKDFTVHNNHIIICTTYTKLIYLIPLNSGTLVNEAANSAKILVSNSDYLENIFAEIENNNELVKQLNKEQNYILATALSNRQDVMRTINCNVIVHNCFNKLEEKDQIFTENVSQYFETNIYIFVISLTFENIHQQIYNILSNIADISTLNITMISNDKILKIITIELEKNFKNMKYVAPLSMEYLSIDFYIEIKIISNIPRAFDGQSNEIILYKHKIVLRSEHFICIPRDDYTIMKKSQNILNHTETANNSSIETENALEQNKNWSLYLKLPENYMEKFKNIDFDSENLDKSKVIFIKDQLNNDKFLNSQDTVRFSIGTEKVVLEVENDGFSEPILKFSSKNFEKALDIRQFVSRLIYKDDGFNNEKQFINWNFYARTENIQKSLKNAITSSAEPEELHRLIEHFEKNVVGSLPL